MFHQSKRMIPTANTAPIKYRKIKDLLIGIYLITRAEAIVDTTSAVLEAPYVKNMLSPIYLV